MRNMLILSLLLHVTMVAAELALTTSSCFACATGNRFQCVGGEGGVNNPWAVTCCYGN